jgi:hypothetical protein
LPIARVDAFGRFRFSQDHHFKPKQPQEFLSAVKSEVIMAEHESERTWKDLADEVAHENDPDKLSALLSELNRLLVAQERRKVLQRLGRKPPTAAA